MITTGFKYYFGAALSALLAAIVFGWVSGGADFSQFPGNLGQFLLTEVMGSISFGYRGGVGNHVGYVILLGLSLVGFALAGITVAFRDADSKALAEQARTTRAPRATIPSSPNWWAPLGAFGAAVVVLAIVLESWVVAILAIAVLALVAFEWMMSAWTDRATDDPETSRALRDQIMGPIEFPVAALLVIGFVVIAFSRVLLAVPRLGASIVAIGVAASILTVAAMISLRPTITKSLAVGALAFGALAFLAGGVVAAVSGEREIEVHHEDGGHDDEEGLGTGRESENVFVAEATT